MYWARGLATRHLAKAYGVRSISKLQAFPRRYTSTASSSENETIELPDGRTLGFARFGSSTGHAVFYLHGFPGSRLEGELFSQPATALGAQLIALDRPGLGLSTFKPHRKVADHAADVSHLAKHLGHTKYSIVGVSGGGPSALACARYHSPDTLRGAALVAAMSPYESVVLKDMRGASRLAFLAFQYAPWLVQPLLRLSMQQLKLSDEKLMATYQQRILNPSWLARVMSGPTAEKDREVWSNPEMVEMLTCSISSARENLRQGIDGFMDEGRLLITPIGFQLSDIPSKQRLRLWYGTQDVNVPLSLGKALEQALDPEITEMTVMDETHLSLVLNQRHRILEDLLSLA